MPARTNRRQDAGNDQARTRRFYTIPEAAEIAAVSGRHLWAEIAAGKITPHRFGERATRIEDTELNRWIDAAKARAS